MILVTGANGFLGQAIIKKLNGKSKMVRGTIRAPKELLFDGIEYVSVGELDANTDWSTVLRGVNVIIHTAARVHVMHEISADALTDFRDVNVDGTMKLARQAAKIGVKRFVYISSIKVNGECSQRYHPFTEDDKPEPVDSYAISKLEAENALFTLAKKTQMEVVIIRPPLVYGPDVKANFLSMMKWLNKGIPLPFGAIHNKRSLVALDNLVDLIITCIDHPAAANQVLLVSDGEDLSTTELLSRVAFSLGKKPRLLPVNQQLLEFGLKLVGKKKLTQRLCGSLQIDISKAKKLLNWTPPISVDEGLRRTAEEFLRGVEGQSKVKSKN
jgi:nucleoside-diphosphate-sugar epimerase